MTDHSLPDNTPWDALARYFAGELPGPEAEELRRWIAVDPDRARLVAELREVWAGAAELRQSWDAEAALRSIKEQPAEPARVIRLPRFYREEPGSRRRRTGLLMARAAAVIALVGGGAWLATQGLAPRQGAPQVSEVATSRGQRASLRLPDGTHVTLGPASTIRYAVAPARGARTVYLEGDAYFVVTHDAARPFSVHTARGTATDLGTRFGVHAYPDDSVLDVVVAEGKVSLAARRADRQHQTPRDSLVLVPGDLGRVSAGGRLTAERGAAVDRHLAWIDGRLEFHDTPLRDAVVQFGRWYDLDVRLVDSVVGRKRLTASFKDEAAQEALRLVAASLDLQVSQRGRVVTIRSK
jgi:ferric-dicitrate binding protein FerR (iron transport regulator)